MPNAGYGIICDEAATRLPVSASISDRPYIVDFACLEAKLIIEVDGSQHFDAKGDVERTQRLHEYGYRVLRFWNNDVLMHTHQVLAAMHQALGSNGPHPGLPPQAGEGDKP